MPHPHPCDGGSPPPHRWTALHAAASFGHAGVVVALLAGRAELCSLVFLGLTAAVVSLNKRTPIKKSINLLALSGILYQRVTGGAGLVSVSFVATVACWAWAAKQLVTN